VNLESEAPHADPSDSPITGSDRRPSLGGGLFSWIVLLVIATCGLALAAAHLPPIFKKLGLFAVAYGLLLGLIGGWLSQFTPKVYKTRRLGAAVVFALALAGQTGIALESYRLDRSERERLERSDPKETLARRLLESANEPSDPKSRATFDEFRRSYSKPGASFDEYLQFRVSGIGIQSKRRAALFWGVEIVSGALAASWVFLRRTRPAR
jgi:hypothetical protein